MHILADEDFPLPAVMRLRELGHDVLTAQEAGIANDETPDSAVIELANQLGRATITHNRQDFPRLPRARPDHAGLILCTRDRDFTRLANRVHNAIAAVNDIRGKLTNVIRPHPGK